MRQFDSADLTLLDLACGGADTDIDYSGFDPSAAYQPPETGNETSFHPGQRFDSEPDQTELSPPGTGMRSEVGIEHDLGVGDRHWQPDDFALKHLRDRDFGAQAQLADELMKRVADQRDLPMEMRTPLTDSERDALELLRRDPQLRGGFDVSAYMKTKCGIGYTKDTVGYSQHTDGPSGAYGEKTVGIEQELDYKAGKVVIYGEHTERDDGTSSDKAGLKLEASRGPLRVGVDTGGDGSVYAKLETPRTTLPNGCTVAYGAQLDVAIPYGNGLARDMASHGLDINRRILEARHNASRGR